MFVRRFGMEICVNLTRLVKRDLEVKKKEVDVYECVNMNLIVG